MSKRVGYWQKAKVDTLAEIVKVVAKSMPRGIEDDKLKAAIEYNFGASKRSTWEYLETLTNANKLDKDEKGIWKVIS
jgi:hypothetical protein